MAGQFVEGLVVSGVPVGHAFAPLRGIGGTLAGFRSVRLVDRWVPGPAERPVR
ncbi:hypothetical protein [Acuticoccus sediminis]|uniref:hypothetical protein n=1 Tax=Acuticoccus sediminis TaxID=2184697 RepID=UPI0013910BED|nr:hypothetical protein [Acuticoccus sediminis]